MMDFWALVLLTVSQGTVDSKLMGIFDNKEICVVEQVEVAKHYVHLEAGWTVVCLKANS